MHLLQSTGRNSYSPGFILGLHSPSVFVSTVVHRLQSPDCRGKATQLCHSSVTSPRFDHLCTCNKRLPTPVIHGCWAASGGLKEGSLPWFIASLYLHWFTLLDHCLLEYIRLRASALRFSSGKTLCPRGLMDKALDFGSRDSRFESERGCASLFFCTSTWIFFFALCTFPTTLEPCPSRPTILLPPCHALDPSKNIFLLEENIFFPLLHLCSTWHRGQSFWAVILLSNFD